MPKKKWRMTLLVLALCVGGVLSFRALKPDPEMLLKKRIAERSKGDAKASLWITEYFDYQCPPCGTAHKVLSDAVLKYPGKIYLQVRYYPLPAHQNALSAAVHSECASRQSGKFWAFHDQLFTHQGQWATDPYAELQFLKFAEEAKIDLPSWDACTKDPATEQFVKDEKAKGESLGVKITPSFFVNGKLIVGVNALTEELKKLETSPAPAA